jgi:hypothetical protein
VDIPILAEAQKEPKDELVRNERVADALMSIA